MALIPPSRLVKQSEVTLRPVWLEMPCFCHRAMLTPESSPSVTGSAWQAGTLLLATGSASSCPGFGWDPESVCEPYLSGGGREWRHPGHLRGQRLGPPLPRDVTQWACRSLRFFERCHHHWTGGRRIYAPIPRAAEEEMADAVSPSQPGGLRVWIHGACVLGISVQVGPFWTRLDS